MIKMQFARKIIGVLLHFYLCLRLINDSFKTIQRIVTTAFCLPYHTLFGTGADWPVGKFGRMLEGPAARREKVRESMETFAFLSISAH